MKRLWAALKRVLHYILYLLGDDSVFIDSRVKEIMRHYVDRVCELDASALPGEGKRHQLYAQALKDHPDVEPYVIGMVVELAVHIVRRR